MTKRPKPGGYKDRQFLADAIRLNQKMTQPMRRLLENSERWPGEQVLALLAQLGILLTQQAHVLHQMELIRRNNDGTAGETCRMDNDNVE